MKMRKEISNSLSLSADENDSYNNMTDELKPAEISNPSDDFHAMYWPMDKWINDSNAADLINSMMRARPELHWNNPLSTQFNAMLSVFQNPDWVGSLTVYYDYTIVDFIRLMLANWPEVFAKKRYASALSAAIVSCLI